MGRIQDFVWRSSFFPRKLSFTREGKGVVALSIGLGIAAVNTGNNLLYMVFGISLALIVISGILSETNLRDLWAVFPGDVRPTAGRATSALVTVRSRRRRFPAFSIEAWPLVDGGKVEPARLLEIRPGRTLDGTCSLTFPRRGEYAVRGVVLSTAFPFSFFRKSMILPAPEALLVHPRVPEVPEAELAATLEGEEDALPIPGRGHEFFGVRDFREGDNPRHVLHRRSASRDNPVVREFERTGMKAVWIALNHASPGGEDGDARVEAAIEKAAGLAVHLLDRGRLVGLATSIGAIPPGSGVLQTRRIMDFLARLPRADGTGVDDGRVLADTGADPSAVVVWARA